MNAMRGWRELLGRASMTAVADGEYPTWRLTLPHPRKAADALQQVGPLSLDDGSRRWSRSRLCRPGRVR